ncbi:MAG: ankyrin repeat domain-containing protein [Psychromonas sp.]
MKTWNSYKQTYRTEPDLFDFARSGDLRGLANILSDSPDVDINAKNHRGYSALMLAVYNGNTDFCEALLRCGADVNSTDAVGNTLLMGAAFKGDLTIIKLLLQFEASASIVNKSNMTAHDWALMFRRSEVLDYLRHHYSTENTSSKLKSIIRFIRLALMLFVSQLKNMANRNTHK